MARWGLVYPWRCDAQGHAAQALARPYFASANDAEGPAMSREAFGDPPDREPEYCPNCGSDFYMPGCTHCDEVKRRCAAESEAMALRGQLGAASGWIVKALKVLDTVDPDDTDEAERLAALVKAGEVLALATLARSKTPNAKLTCPTGREEDHE
jgi:hypothetical protein